MNTSYSPDGFVVAWYEVLDDDDCESKSFCVTTSDQQYMQIYYSVCATFSIYSIYPLNVVMGYR